MKDCTTCKYGFVDEQLGFPMCHHPKRFSEDCVDFNMHEEVEEPKKATGIEEKNFPEGLEEAARLYAKIPREGKYEWYDGGKLKGFKAGAQWRDAQIPKLPDNLAEAAEESSKMAYPYKDENHEYDKDKVDETRGCYKEGFKAGVEWQKEQDQPITGNSLEQEWLRYVDKKKKEYGGELPSLGEYGWLQIARHFAEWGAEHLKK